MAFRNGRPLLRLLYDGALRRLDRRVGVGAEVDNVNNNRSELTGAVV
jgi:hypothetical protein